MTKAKISEYSATANDNTDVNGINIAEGCPPSSMNNMGREIMAALKRFQVGSDGDGVTVGGSLVVSGSTTANTLSATVFQIDTISEKTSAAGVTVDGVLLKDSQVSTDQINEKTSATGVTIDGVLLKDSEVTTDVIKEKTSATGVTVDSVLLKDGMVVTDSSMNFRNRIINGDMRIDQRNAGASVTLTNTGIYTVDRWIGIEDTDGVMTAQQSSTAPTGFVNSLICTTTTADASLGATQYCIVAQSIEGLNVADLGWGTANAKTVTLSFWTRSSLTGTFGGALKNSASNRSYPFTYTISAADTWEQKSVTIAGDTSGTWLTTNGIGIQINFGLGVGSTYSGTAGAWAGSNFVSATGATSVIGTLNATWYITGVQLEVGSVATPFERRPYGTELSLCQRYCQKFGGTGVYDHIGFGFASSTTAGRIHVPLKVTMRSAPSVTSATLAVTDVAATTSSVSSLSIASGETNENIGYVTATTTGLTQFRPCFLITNNSTSGYVIFAAEL